MLIIKKLSDNNVFKILTFLSGSHQLLYSIKIHDVCNLRLLIPSTRNIPKKKEKEKINSIKKEWGEKGGEGLGI